MEPAARAYQAMLRGFIRDGRAQHYTELAAELGITPEEALELLRTLTTSGLPIFFQAGTDHIAGFTPFSNIATHCRISVDGIQRWYAICAVEALAVSWLFPGRTVRVDAACLDCGDPVLIEMRDGDLLSCEPETAIAHTNLPAARWAEDWPFA